MRSGRRQSADGGGPRVRPAYRAWRQAAMKRAVRIPILLLVAAACGDAPLTAPASGTGKVQVVTGQDQTGVVGSVLPAPVEVRVTSRSGSPLSEQIVYFKILKGG